MASDVNIQSHHSRTTTRRTYSLEQVATGIELCSNNLLFFLKRAMVFGARVAIVGSETKVYQV
jgi:hypothetical protein